MDRDKVGEDNCADQLLLGFVVLFSVFDNGERGGHALIAAARNDYNRKLAAAHSCIRTRRGGRHSANLNVVSKGR